MMSAVQEFSSMGEFLKRVEEEIEVLRKTMGNFLRRLEEARIKAEKQYSREKFYLDYSRAYIEMMSSKLL